MRLTYLLTSIFLFGSEALAQQTGQQIADDQAIPGLMFFTLFAALAVGIGALIFFLRRRSNRDAMRRAMKD